MARNAQKKQKQMQRKLRQRKARNQKKLARSADIHVPAPSARIARELEEIYLWLEDGGTDRAFEQLGSLARRFPNSAAVAEVEHGLYQRVGDRARTSRAARRFLKLVPQNPEAMFAYAQSAMFCFRVAVALIQFRNFLDRWPNHELAANARDAIEVCEFESRSRVAVANEKGDLDLEFEEGGLEFFVRHEESLVEMESRNFAQAIALLEENIKQQPRFMSSRNNLAICQFYQGDLEEAVRTSRTTCELAPDNRFAQASLIKIEFLSGNPEKANELADAAIANPPQEQDAFTALVESFGYLGRDEDLIMLSQMMDQVVPLEENKQADLLHLFATAHFRAGDRVEAKKLWEACFDTNPDHDDALQNLDDIAMEHGHAAWGQGLDKWLPWPFMEEMLLCSENSSAPTAGALSSENPVIATIVPALLDRGDPAGREFALDFAIGDGTPPMLAALKDFAFSNRGPDALRYKALMKLKAKLFVDAGSHRFYSRGNWTEIKLMGFEITEEPVEVEPWKSELLETGYWAMSEGKLEQAEASFQEVLDRDPDCRSARFNLARVWHRRQRGDEFARAESEFRKIHTDHPDYSFAVLAVAMMEAKAGNMERAKKMIGSIFERPKLHVSEAMMLLTTQVQVALFDDDLGTAESSLEMMCQITHEDDPRVVQLREMIVWFVKDVRAWIDEKLTKRKMICSR